MAKAGVASSEDKVILTAEQVQERLADLPGWAARGPQIFRRYEFKGFAKATQMANLVAWHSDRTGHHADISFGWGYCEVVYTNHDAGGVTENDFVCAKKLESLLT